MKICLILPNRNNCEKGERKKIELSPHFIIFSRVFLKNVKEIEEKKAAGNTAFQDKSYQLAIDLWTECINLDSKNKLVTTKVNIL